MKKLTKSTTDVQIAGVCAGIAEYFEVDPTLIRLGFVVITLLGVGSPIFLYLVLALLMPES